MEFVEVARHRFFKVINFDYFHPQVEQLMERGLHFLKQ